MAEAKRIAKVTKDRVNKKDLVKQVKIHLAKRHNTHDVSLVMIANTLDAIVDSMLHCIKQNKEVFWSGLGVLGIQKRKQTVRRNPHNGQEIKIPAKEVVKLKLFKSFVEKCMTKTVKKTKK